MINEPKMFSSWSQFLTVNVVTTGSLVLHLFMNHELLNYCKNDK